MSESCLVSLGAESRTRRVSPALTSGEVALLLAARALAVLVCFHRKGASREKEAPAGPLELALPPEHRDGQREEDATSQRNPNEQILRPFCLDPGEVERVDALTSRQL